jgi:myo-inositol-1(or 4)-monophosphatase
MSETPDDTTEHTGTSGASPELRLLGAPTRRLAQSAADDVVRAERILHELLDAIGPGLVATAGRATVERKADGTPVTPHDRATDERIVAAVLDAFPAHGAVSEEAEHVAPGTDWTWVLDPIDGTSNFLAGLPYWCTSIALCLEGRPVLAVVDAPALGLRLVAQQGSGTRSGEGPVRVMAPVDLYDPYQDHVPALCSSGAARDLFAAGVRLNSRLMGAAALDLSLVARGTAPLAMSRGPHVWDVAAAALLVEEAGGSFATWDGMPLLPLVPGRDYADLRTPAVTATDDETAREAARAATRGRTLRTAQRAADATRVTSDGPKDR